jgi:hypothetical protein
MLLGAKADPNKVGGENELVTPLYYAATRGTSVDCVQALLWRGANPNHISWANPLVWAISKARMPSQQKIAILDALANHSSPFDVDGSSCEGRTALMEAVERGDEDLVKWLLGHRANVAVIDKLGETALFPAVRGANIDILCELLKQEGVPLHTINGKGQGLLQLASKGNQLIGTLVCAGAEPIIDSYGGREVDEKDASLNKCSDTVLNSSPVTGSGLGFKARAFGTAFVLFLFWFLYPGFV